MRLKILAGGALGFWALAFYLAVQAADSLDPTVAIGAAVSGFLALFMTLMAAEHATP